MKSIRFLVIPLVIMFSCNQDEDTSGIDLSQYNSTYDIIQGEIWNTRCTSCHTSGTSFANQSDLVLTADVSYDQLMNRLPANQSARTDGLVLLGDKGLESLYQSFLWEKINALDQEHFYADHPEYGSLMPLGGDFLTNGQLEFIREWIIAGAPREGEVADVTLLEDETVYESPPFQPLEVPTSGYQFHVAPFEIPPQADREVFIYEELNNEAPVYVKEIEINMAPGSHHFIIYTYPEGGPDAIYPKPGILRDVYYSNGDYNEITLFFMQFQIFVTGTQWPQLRYQFPEGVALKLPPNTGFDLNSHYANSKDESIIGEVYANMHTVDSSEVIHEAEILQLNNQDIFLPAGQVTTIKKTYRFDEDVNIFQLFSHAHEHMTEFKVLISGGTRDGELIYVTFDWEHPPILKLDPPLLLEAGQGLRLEAIYDNDEDRDLRFGLRSTDEMMILFGAYYK
jgi:hypothetical protein